jgi:purine-nucleoside phosphorylase
MMIGSTSSGIYERVQASREAIAGRLGGRRPVVAMILGSGLGAFADRLTDAVAIPYAEIPSFAVSTVIGHAGKLVVGKDPASGLQVAALQGRVHAYEGHSLETVVHPARTLVALGARTVLVTNAAGGVRRDLTPGDIVVLRDHLNLLGQNPLSGPNDDRLGPRFPDMSYAYDPSLRELARSAAADVPELGRSWTELPEGVYACLPGPSYETPAEIEMLRRMGADLVGMSTVPEVIAARHMGARCLGLSCVTNLAAGSGQILSHDEVAEVANRTRPRFVGLLSAILTRIAAEPAGG